MKVLRSIGKLAGREEAAKDGWNLIQCAVLLDPSEEFLRSHPTVFAHSNIQNSALRCVSCFLLSNCIVQPFSFSRQANRRKQRKSGVNCTYVRTPLARISVKSYTTFHSAVTDERGPLQRAPVTTARALHPVPGSYGPQPGVSGLLPLALFAVLPVLQISAMIYAPRPLLALSGIKLPLGVVL